MNILGIDTTTKNASCTVLKNNEYNTKCISNEVTHSEKLLPIIHETLSENDLTLDNIDLLAAINGPGSFTGIRIGLATIKAFAQVKGIDIYSISSIDLIAYTAAKKYFEEKIDSKVAFVLSLIDARNNRVYYAISKVTKEENGKLSITHTVDVGNDLIEDVISGNSFETTTDSLIFAGDCVKKYNDTLSRFPNAILMDFYPTTEDLIDSYLNIDNTASYLYNAYTLDALYARPSQAERMAKKDE